MFTKNVSHSFDTTEYNSNDLGINDNKRLAQSLKATSSILNTRVSKDSALEKSTASSYNSIFNSSEKIESEKLSSNKNVSETKLSIGDRLSNTSISEQSPQPSSTTSIHKLNVNKTKFPNIRRLSIQAGSFFSRSCPAEEIIVNTKESVVPKISTPANAATTEKRRLYFKSSLFAFSNKQYRNRLTTKQSFDATLTLTENKYISRRRSSNELSTTNNSTKNIGNYEIDLERLTRELAFPTIDKPLTSYKELEQDQEDQNNGDDDEDVGKS